MNDDILNDPAAYLRELQRIEREQELAKLRTLSLEFAGVLNFFPKLLEELEAFHYADGIAFDGLADRLRPSLKQAANLKFDLDTLPNELLDVPELQLFVRQIKQTMGLQSVELFYHQLSGVRTYANQQLARKKFEAEQQAKEEAQRQEQERLAAEQKVKEEEARIQKIQDAEKYIKWQIQETVQIAAIVGAVGGAIGGGISGWMVADVTQGLVWGGAGCAVLAVIALVIKEFNDWWWWKWPSGLEILSAAIVGTIPGSTGGAISGVIGAGIVWGAVAGAIGSVIVLCSLAFVIAYVYCRWIE